MMSTTTQIGEVIDDARHDIEALLDDAPVPESDADAAILNAAARKAITLALDRLASVADRVREELFDRKEVDEEISDAKDELRAEIDTHTEEIEAVSAAADKVLGRETLDEDFDRFMLRRALRDLRAVVRVCSAPDATGTPPLWTHD